MKLVRIRTLGNTEWRGLDIWIRVKDIVRLEQSAGGTLITMKTGIQYLSREQPDTVARAAEYNPHK